jgi:hypothetical protein
MTLRKVWQHSECLQVFQNSGTFKGVLVLEMWNVLTVVTVVEFGTDLFDFRRKMKNYTFSLFYVPSNLGLRIRLTWPPHFNSYTGCFMTRKYYCRILVHLLTAIRLTPGGSSTAHIYTQTMHRTTQLTTLVGRLSGVRTQSCQTKINDELTA